MKHKAAYTAILGCVLLLPFTCGTPYAHHIRGKQVPAYYHPVELMAKRKKTDNRAQFRKVQEYAIKESAAFLRKKIEKNHFIQRITPLILESLFKTFVPAKSGEIKLKSPASIMDGTVNSLIREEKKSLTKWTQGHFPTLPLLGNMASEILDSQKLQLFNGSPGYEMQLKKRVAAEHQLGNLSFSGGIETRLMGRKFGRTPVAAFRYADQDNSYGLHVYGKNVNFDIDTKHV
ncbi:hypothetical protein MYX75_08795, partial [Acidobacteria bacterium AH-259-A15]|nr:hypothetical protein [Acidobacteria bacterium AH-259-A15]